MKGHFDLIPEVSPMILDIAAQGLVFHLAVFAIISSIAVPPHVEKVHDYETPQVRFLLSKFVTC